MSAAPLGTEDPAASNGSLAGTASPVRSRFDVPSPQYRIREVLERDRALVAAHRKARSIEAQQRANNFSKALRSAFGAPAEQSIPKAPETPPPPSQFEFDLELVLDGAELDRCLLEESPLTPEDGEVLEGEPEGELDEIELQWCDLEPVVMEPEVTAPEVMESMVVEPPPSLASPGSTRSMVAEVPTPGTALPAEGEGGCEEYVGRGVPVPIRTRTMARLLVAQGRWEQALEIYGELLSQAPADASLRAEALAASTKRGAAEAG